MKYHFLCCFVFFLTIQDLRGSVDKFQLKTPDIVLLRKMLLSRRQSIGINTDKPRQSEDTPVDCDLYFDVYRFIHLNDIDEILTVMPDLKLVWNDPYWSWEGLQDFEHINSIRSTSQSSWKPHVLHMNNAEDVYVMTRQLADVETMYIYKDGNVTWYPTLPSLNTLCHLDLTNFPFDKQECSFELGLIEDCNSARLNNVGFRRDQKKSIDENELWEIVDFQAKKVSSCAGFKTGALFTLTFKRKPQQFISSAILPMAFLSLVQIATLAIPVSSTDRACYSVTVQLAFGVLHNNIRLQIPTGPILSKIIIFNTILDFLSTVTTIYAAVSCYLFNHFEHKAKVKFDSKSEKYQMIKKWRNILFICDSVVFSVYSLCFLAIAMAIVEMANS